MFERYRLNVAQFSAAKDMATNRQLQSMLFKEDGSIKGWSQFKKDAEPIAQHQYDTWLRVEYENSRRQAGTIAQFTRFQDDADLYPYWVYRGRMDGKERLEHVAMEGKVFRIGDPAGDACFPPNDWNCRCTGDQADGRYLSEKGVQAQTADESKKLLEENVDDQFQYNPAKVGVMPNSHSYFDVMPDANAGNAQAFGLLPPPSDGPQLTGLQAKGLHYVMNIIALWERAFHTDAHDNIVFQNHRLLTNVVLPSRVVHQIAKHHRGIDNLPRTVQNPSEVWSKWENVGEQKSVLRSYLLFGRVSYVVLTQDGVILDAFPANNKEINKYRSGVII